jgi:hypothetical protein
MKKCFYDCEFTGLHQHTTLISIGIVSDCGREFYAESTDFDESQIDGWINRNVMSQLIYLRPPTPRAYGPCFDGDYDSNLSICGNNKTIKHHMVKWLESFEEEIELWNDCLAYDWVLFCELFGGAANIPEFISYFPFNMCTIFKIYGIDPDISREAFARKRIESKHNALFDAKVIKNCYERVLELDAA